MSSSPDTLMGDDEGQEIRGDAITDITVKKRNRQNQSAVSSSGSLSSSSSSSNTTQIKKKKPSFPSSRLRAGSIWSQHVATSNHQRDLLTTSNQFKSNWIAAHCGYTVELSKRQKKNINKQAKAALEKWKAVRNPEDEHLSTEMQTFIQLKEQIYLKY